MSLTLTFEVVFFYFYPGYILNVTEIEKLTGLNV